MKRILFTGSEKYKVSFSSAQIVEHLSACLHAYLY